MLPICYGAKRPPRPGAAADKLRRGLCRSELAALAVEDLV